MPDFQRLHFRSVEWLLSLGWRAILPIGPRLIRADRGIRAVNEIAVAERAPRAEIDTAALTREVKESASARALSGRGDALGRQVHVRRVARDERRRPRDRGDRGAELEATQAIPGHWSERGALNAYVELLTRSAKLAQYLKSRGFKAQSHDLQGRGQVIPFAVEAGLGQLGLNGQLLTPHSGSRCRISLIDTDAPLDLDAPVDYGIEGICDSCRVCVRRCPPGAITAQRKLHRGVMKAKIDTARCFPVIAQTDACAVCMKVCPVQRYGLNAVVQEWEASGKILGKDTDELEGYYWIDGRRYGPGEKPRITRELLQPKHLVVDFNRKKPENPGVPVAQLDSTT